MLRLAPMMLRPACRSSRLSSAVASRIPKQLLTGQRRLASSSHPYESNHYDAYARSVKRANGFLYAMVGLNVAAYAAWSYVRNSRDSKGLQQLYDHAALSWQNVRSGRYWTLITCAFSHLDTNHLIFNMLALTTFGMGIARSGAGVGRVMGLFVGSGVAGSAAWLYEHRDDRSIGGWGSQFQHRDQIKHMAMGASGIVSGFAGAAALLAPFDKIILLFVPMPLWLGVALYGAFDLYYLGSENSRVGHSAHLGGMAFGMLFYITSLRRFEGVFHSLRRMR